MSLLDIKSAHNSLLLTPRASELLNCILPNYSTIRFVRSPFGLKNVNSTFDRVLTEILKDLINAHLVLLYTMILFYFQKEVFNIKDCFKQFLNYLRKMELN